MKLKSSAIAVAVAGALGASMTAQAESGFYADLRIGFQSTKTGGPSGDTEIQIENQVSRFGFRGSTDMGNGLTGFGRMEFGLNTEEGKQATAATTASGIIPTVSTGGAIVGSVTSISGETERPVITRRHAYVGLRGDWGEVKIGQTYHTFYSMITGPLDNPMLGTAGAWLGYTGRTNQALTYTGEWGIFKLGATGYFDDSSTDAAGKSDDLDAYELAGAFQAGPINLALGVAGFGDVAGVSQENLIGLTASGWQTGIFTWGLGYTQQDAAGTSSADKTGIVFDVLIGNGYVHYEQTETKASGATPKMTPSALTLGYMQSLGRQTSMYYEYETIDADTSTGTGDTDNITVALRYQWK